MEKEIASQKLTLKVWFGGSIKKIGGKLNYNGRSFRTVKIDKDEFCWFTLLEEAEKSSKFNRNVDALYFLNLNGGIQRAFDDKDAMLMLECAIDNRVVECYIILECDVPEVMKLLEVGVEENKGVKARKKLIPRRKVSEVRKCAIVGVNKGATNVTSPSETLKESPIKSQKKDALDYSTIPCNKAIHYNEKTPQKTPKKLPSLSSQVLRTSPRLAIKNSTEIAILDLTTSQPPLIQSNYDFNEITLSKYFDSLEEEADLVGLRDLERGFCIGGDEGSESDNSYKSEESVAVGGDDSDDVEELSDVDEESGGANVEEDIGSDDNSDEEVVEARNKLKEWNVNVLKIVKQLEIEASAGLLPEQKAEEKTVEETSATGDDHISDYDESGEEIDTPGESEDESRPGKRKKSNVPVINERTDFAKLKWCVGIKFSSRDIFRDCVTRYALAQGKNLSFDISDQKRGKRLGVKCKSGCPFKLYGSWDNKAASFVVKSVHPKHNCQRTMERNRQLKSTWLAQQFLDVFKAKPHWPASDIVETVRKAYKVLIKRGFAYKVKYHAHRMLHGSMREHYSKLGSYMAALKQGNPSSCFFLFTNPDIPRSPQVFQRFFVCFDALKQGWVIGCRKVICVDACFLKTFLGGQLISAVGRDANEQMFPLAWAVVEGENNQSYEWFFKQLKSCLGENDGDGWTIISDEHLSIVTMVAQEFPKAEHRHCARHIFAHWHKSYKGEEMKLLFWNCAKAYNEADFNDAFKAMKEVDPLAAQAFLAYNPRLFCRAFVKTHSVNDVIVNNMAETFNAYIIKSRTMHLLYMLEDIRVALMQRMINKKRAMEARNGLLCPRVQARLDKEKNEASECEALPSSLTVFEVTHGIEKFVVDIEARTCTCRKWDLTGVPCCHGVAAINFNSAEAEEYVHEAYTRETYLKIYNGTISPCAGERHWPNVNLPLNPPPIKIGPGRPRKNRRRDPSENPKKSGTLTRYGMEMTCSICKAKTHNKRKCPQKDEYLPQAPPPKRGRGRPKAVVNDATATTNATPLSTAHYDATAHPSRVGRGGRTIKSGKGSRGAKNTGVNKGSGIGRGAGISGRGRQGTTKALKGVGILFDDSGNAYTNGLSTLGGPIRITSQTDGQPMTQVSSNQL